MVEHVKLSSSEQQNNTIEQVVESSKELGGSRDFMLGDVAIAPLSEEGGPIPISRSMGKGIFLS